MKTARQILLEKAKSYREEQDRLEEIEYSNRRDELARIRRARKDESVMQYMRNELNKNRTKGEA